MNLPGTVNDEKHNPRSVGPANPPAAGTGALDERQAGLPAFGGQAGVPAFGGQAGFTLVELLVVILIITLLAGMSMPAILKIKDEARWHKAKSTISLLESACNFYRVDFNDQWPPSSHAEYAGWKGRQLLPLFLTGYGPDANSNHAPGANLATDDGKNGYGYRISKSGKVYGLYGAENVSMRKSGGRPVFIDAFDNDIFYYRFDRDQETYQRSDDTDGPDMPAYVQDPDGNFYRRSIVLMSAGPDRLWKRFASERGESTDDVTNFLE